MNKAISIQRSKILSAYGGVGTNIDTIDNISLIIRPFDEWNIFDKVMHPNQNKDIKRLLFKEDRHRFMPIEEWRSEWNLDQDWDKHAPACVHCSGKSGRGYHRSPIQQTRFVMASMETGDIIDIPWQQIFSKKGSSDKKTASVWYIDKDTKKSQSVKFTMSKGSADLYGISISNEKGVKVTMAELMTRYIVMPDENGHEVVYHPVIRNSNNVLFWLQYLKRVYPKKRNISICYSSNQGFF